MENVPALGGDDVYRCGVEQLRESGYDIAARVLHYDRFGAATKRRRLFTIGVLDVRGGGHLFLRLLREHHAQARTVRDAIARFRDLPRGSYPDHDWSELKTIPKYRDRYESGQYGWTRLDYDSPAPSFGSVAKTYILHPEAAVDGYPERVLSVREVLAIMGFPDSVRFPEGTSRAKRYQMVANSVSPQVSRAVALTVRSLLTGTP
jgi:DNA (cytosine-5)-methyltransferase 1